MGFTEILNNEAPAGLRIKLNKMLREIFSRISGSLALGETSGTAYRGDRGKTAYDHSQAAHAPSTATKYPDTGEQAFLDADHSKLNAIEAGAQANASGGTLTSELNLGENAGLVLDSALSEDGKYSGIVKAGIAGAALAFGQLCYFQASDSRWELVDANLSAGYDKKLGICVLAAASDGDATKMLLFGDIRADTQFPALTIGSAVYMSETAGAIVVAQPTTADACIRIIGFGNTADELHFCPSPDYMIHV